MTPVKVWEKRYRTEKSVFLSVGGGEGVFYFCEVFSFFIFLRLCRFLVRKEMLLLCLEPREYRLLNYIFCLAHRDLGKGVS